MHILIGHHILRLGKNVSFMSDDILFYLSTEEKFVNF
jgi:hypothetical protein